MTRKTDPDEALDYLAMWLGARLDTLHSWPGRERIDRKEARVRLEEAEAWLAAHDLIHEGCNIRQPCPTPPNNAKKPSNSQTK